MADFLYEDLLPIGDDTTEYRLLTTEGGVDSRGTGRPHLPAGRAGSDALADRNGAARHLSLPAHGSPDATREHPRRSRSVEQRQVRRARSAKERQYRRCRRSADVPGHRNRHRHGQAWTARTHARRRREVHCPRCLRRIHASEPALLAERPHHDVGREEHRQQLARADRAVRRYCCRTRELVQVPLHGQGRRKRQQVLPVPGNQSDPEPRLDDAVPRGEDPLTRHRSLPALPPCNRRRRYFGRVRDEDGEVRVGALSRRIAHRRRHHGPRLPRSRTREEGLRAHAEDRHRRTVRR